MNGHIPRHKEKAGSGAGLNITWNANDGIIAAVFLAAVLTGVYFGSARIFIALSERELLSENISNISFIVLNGFCLFLVEKLRPGCVDGYGGWSREVFLRNGLDIL